MKKFFLILSLALGLLVSAFGADSPPYPSLLTVGVYDNPPKLSVSPSGKASGFHIDLLDAILEGTGIEVRYVAGTFEESLQRLERGEIDLLLDVAYSDERALRFDFTTESILTNWAVVYAGRYSKIENFTDLDGARVAVLKDSIHTTGKEGIVAMAAEYGISLNLIYLDSYDECFAALRSGKADAAVVNRLFGLMSETGDDPRRTSILFNPSQIRYAFAKGGEHNAALIALFDSRLNSLKASPESAYRRAFDTYLGPQISKETSGLPWLGIATTLVIAILFMLLFIVYAIRVGKSDKVEIQRFIDNLQTMEDIRKSIVNNSLVAYSVFSLLLALMAIRHLVIVGNDIFIWFYLPAQILPAVISLFKDRLSLSFKTTALLILLLLSGTVITLARGNSGISFSYFFLAAILSTMLQGRRLGMATLASGLAVVLMALILNYTGILHSTVTDASFFLSPSSWAFSVLSFFMFFFAILAGMKDFYTSLTKAVVNLEEGIAERTRNIKAINEELKNEIDEHMKTEEKLSQARHEAEQANRTKSSFFAGISHELRTPLNAILGYSQILMRDASLSKESMRQVETIKTSGEHLLGLINEVLEMSRIEAGKVRLDLSPCAISSVLEEIRMLFAGQASRKGLAFSVREESPLPDCVMTDRSKLKQILINLVGNAMKFTDSGFIDVRVAGSAQHPDIVEFSVRDTGKGIPPDAITRIFLPFEQTIEGRSQGGTGLGLPICRNYCELLGGKISAESSLGKGSRIFLHDPGAGMCGRQGIRRAHPLESGLHKEFGAAQDPGGGRQIDKQGYLGQYARPHRLRGGAGRGWRKSPEPASYSFLRYRAFGLCDARRKRQGTGRRFASVGGAIQAEDYPDDRQSLGESATGHPGPGRRCLAGETGARAKSSFRNKTAGLHRLQLFGRRGKEFRRFLFRRRSQEALVDDFPRAFRNLAGFHYFRGPGGCEKHRPGNRPGGRTVRKDPGRLGRGNSDG